MPERIPDSDKLEWKPLMLERYSKLTDIDQLKEFSLSFLKKSVRVNTLKISIDDLKKRLSKDWVLEQIPWCEEGFWVTHKQGRRDIGNTVEHALGYFYVQEAASMIPPVVLSPKEHDLVLDMCAAPGSKTTQLAEYMKNKGVLVANDISSDRLAALGINLQRCGVINVMITQMHGMKDLLFDKILVDAPCSGTGTIRKSLRTLQTWSVPSVHKLANEQKKIMDRAWKMLKPGGVMVYSTCSLEPEENECNVSWFLETHSDADCVEFDLEIKRAKPVTEWDKKVLDKRVAHTLRLWPQDNDTEGFFVSRIVKKK